MKYWLSFFLVTGVLFVLFSAWYGLAFGGIFLENGPVIQGWVGGLTPTITALFGAFLIRFSLQHLEVRRSKIEEGAP